MSKTFCPTCGVCELEQETGVCDYCDQVAANDTPSTDTEPGSTDAPADPIPGAGKKKQAPRKPRAPKADNKAAAE